MGFINGILVIGVLVIGVQIIVIPDLIRDLVVI